jgi:RNA polymerase sigma-70 factor (ECF subfamily)
MSASRADDYDEFYARTYQHAYHTALGITGSRSAAEDATQEAYCSAYRQRGSFRGDGPPEAWLQRIVVNAAIDHCRRLRRRATTPSGDDTLGARDPFLDSHPERLALAAAIAELPSRYRAAIVLHYFHGYPLRMLGEILGVSEGAAAMILHRALVGLRSSLQERDTRAPGASQIRPGKEA